MARFDISEVPLLSLTPAFALKPLSGTIQTFQMRAYNTSLSQYVYWSSYGAPDVAGVASPYVPSNLTAITVVAVTGT